MRCSTTPGVQERGCSVPTAWRFQQVSYGSNCQRAVGGKPAPQAKSSAGEKLCGWKAPWAASGIDCNGLAAAD